MGESDALPQRGDLAAGLLPVGLGRLLPVVGPFGHAGFGGHRAAAAGQAPDRLRCQDGTESEAAPRLVQEDPVEDQQVTDRAFDGLVKGVGVLPGPGIEDGGGDGFQIARLRVGGLPSVVRGVVTQPAQEQIADLCALLAGPLAGLAAPLGALLFLAVEEAHRDVPLLQGVLEVEGLDGMVVGVDQAQPGRVAGQFACRTARCSHVWGG